MPDPASFDRPWLTSYPPGVPPTYDYPDVAVTRFLDDAARDFPGNVATSFLGVELTYADLLDWVDRIAAALGDLGVARGDRVGLVLPNTPASVIAFFAILRLGAVAVPLDPRHTEDELHHQLHDSGCSTVICLTPLLPRLNAVRNRLPTLHHVVATGIEDWLPRRKRLLFRFTGRRSGAYRRLREGDEARSLHDVLGDVGPIARQAPVARDDLAVIQYTAGTTGPSRGVMLSHGNLVANAFQSRLWLPDTRAGKERVLAVLPLSHVYGLTIVMLTTVLSAGTLILLPEFDPTTTLEAIDRLEPTLLPGVPTMYRALVDHPRIDDYDLSSLRACMSGAAPLPPALAERFEPLTRGGRLREGYGLSESSPLTHANPVYGRSETGKIGLPVTDTIAAVVDPDDPTTPLPPGERGELIVHGPQIMLGYWGHPEETAAAVRDGWLLTGDIAVMDPDGMFAIVDRRKDVVIVGGTNVFPRDVEDVLHDHPGVEQAVVIGVPDERVGETIKAFVVPRRGASLTAGELDAHCRQKLADYKVPSSFELRDELPQNLMGKVLRRRLRDEAGG